MTNPLTKLVKDIEEGTEEGAVMVMDAVTKTNPDIIPTGIKALDEILGIGGIPLGKITEIFGDSGTGKTTICLHLIKQCTLQGLSAGFVDFENAISYARIEKMGIDKSKVLISQPDTGEQGLEIIEMMIRSKRVSLVICDSVAAMTPKSEIDKDFGDAPMGSHARLMSQAMRKLIAIVGKYNVALVFTNQIRAKLGTFFPEKTTTGGNAMKFYSSVRMELKRVGSVEDGKGNKLAGKYKAVMIKNRFAVPYKDAEYYINETGIYTKEKKHD